VKNGNIVLIYFSACFVLVYRKANDFFYIDFCSSLFYQKRLSDPKGILVENLVYFNYRDNLMPPFPIYTPWISFLALLL
jgi:hypothetical protein